MYVTPILIKDVKEMDYQALLEELKSLESERLYLESKMNRI